MAANEVRLLVIGPGAGLSASIARALEASGIRVTVEPARVTHVPSVGRADVLMVGDELVLHDLLEARADDGLPPMVVRSADGGVATALREAGVPGWAIVSPDSSADELAAAILAAARGFAVRPALPPRHVRATRLRDGAPDFDRLTDREREVLALVSEGLPNKRIAARLGISEHTVKYHLSSIFSKLGVSSRTEAVRRGVRSGLIEF